MILRIDSISLRRGIRWSCLLFLLAASIEWAGATALAQTVDARVASVKGTALRRNNQRSFTLARGDLLNPGDEIDTRGGGRVVIDLTDGSVIVVHPNSRIVIRNYRAAASMREMFRILIGRVRIKVAHYGGKPNPYRVNSPTASILVRGTEFSVAVEPSGDTRVEVYEGLVEVQSLSDPRRRVYLSEGRGALVKPNEDIRFYTPGSENRKDERGGSNDADNNDGGDNAKADNNDGAKADKNANAGLNSATDAIASLTTATKANAGGNTSTNSGLNTATNGNGDAGNANAGVNAKTNGSGGAGNANTSANAKTNGNAGVNAKIKDNGGLNAKTNDNVAKNANAGDNAKTKDNVGVNAKTNDNAAKNANAGDNSKTNASGGDNAKTKDNAGANTKTNDNAAKNANAGANNKTNANAAKNANTGVNVKTNASSVGNDNASLPIATNDNAGLTTDPNDNAGARANPNANAKRNYVGGRAVAAEKSPALRPDGSWMEIEKETSGEAVGKSAARPSGDNNPIRDDVAANATTSVRSSLTNDYERYVDSLAGRGWSIPLQRFPAIADSHFDSLDNPAYSTEFASIEGRAWLIPFFNKSRGGNLQSGSTGFPFSSNLVSPFDSGLLAQADFFIPLEKVRMVIGGAVAVSSDRSQSLTVDPAPASLIRLLPEGGQVSRYVAVSTETTSITGSLMAARRFGDDGRTSVGVGVEWVSGGDDLRGQMSLANDARSLAVEELEADSQINRLRLRLGMTRAFSGGHKLGLVYSHELATAADRDRSRFFVDGPLGLDSTRQEGRSSEVSFRLRGPITRRLVYGLEGSLLWGESDGQIRRSVLTDSTTRADMNSAAVGFGVGFALRRATVLTADFGFGFSGVREERIEDATGNLVEGRRERGRFVSGRVGLQTDVWRSLFFSASTLVFRQAATTDLDLRPDLFGRRLTSLGLIELSGRSRLNSTSLFSDFGSGWRFNRNMLAEYIFSINNGLGPTRHIFLLRYTFKRED